MDDISDLQARLAAATGALLESNKRAVAGQLALEIMHEVRNPLEALGNLLFLARTDISGSEELRHYMLLAEEQLANLNELVSRTLSFARPSAQPTAMSLVAVLEAALRIHQRAIERKKIHLVRDIAYNLTSDLYAAEMLQVVSNLLMNALHALPDSGVLCLRLRKRRDKIHVVIADNGHGIPWEHRSQIFEPFFTTKKEQGNGLGLSLSKEIVERNRGKISMRSSVRPAKSGTTFRISLPCSVLSS